jgi:hypothetical protein
VDLSKDQLQTFNPRDPLYHWKLWVRIVSPDTIWYHIFWGRIALALVALCLAGWLAASTAAWAFVKYQRGYKEVAFVDLALFPLRRAHYREGLGRHYLALGRTELERKNYREGCSLLAAALARLPDDLPTRRLVAITEVRLGLPLRALRTLGDAPPRARTDLDCLKLLFGLLLEAQEDERVLAHARTLLPDQPDAVLAHQFVALHAATAHFHRGRYDDAERLITDWQLDKSLEGALLVARSDWERGYTQLALLRLESELARFPQRDELYLYLIRFHRELGRLGGARRYAILRNLRDSTSPGPRIDLLRSYHATHDTAAVERELATFLADFKTNPQDLVLLAWLAVDNAQPALASKIHALATEQGFPINAFNLARIQSALAAQEFRPALTACDQAAREENEDNPNFLSTLNGLRSLALFGLKDHQRGEVMLAAYLSPARPRAADALLLARQLRLLGAADQARTVLDRACAVDPFNQAVLAELVRLEAEAGDRANTNFARLTPVYLVRMD